MPLDAPLEVRSTIESINIKSGRSGTLGFLSLRNRWYSGDVCGIDELQTAVYREAASDSAPAPAPAPAPVAQPPAGDWQARFTPSAPLLFRYSAVSFNTHRIHYDHPYTTGVEGYPGLVVHGPLLGTLMLDTWRNAHPDKTPRQFVFRNQQPAFVDNEVSCGGVEIEPGKSRVWVRHADGSEHVAGEVSYD
jgi:hydroxyacyl-ACP dehydratase HTD2-like protein with hotdog domain